ncbi:hypothetical protein ES703_09112 [subsurface metagenome]
MKIERTIKLKSIQADGYEIFPNKIWSLHIEDNKYIVIGFVKGIKDDSKREKGKINGRNS